MAAFVAGAAVGAFLGGDSTQTIEQQYNMSVLNKSVYEQITKTEARASAAQASVQNLRYKFRDMEGCAITGSQTIKADAISSSQLSVEVVTELKNSITNDLQASVQAQLERVTELGSMDFGDQNVQQDLDLQVENLVENTLVTETINEAIAEQVNIQNNEIEFRDCKDSTLDFSQDVIAQVAAKTITSALTNAIASNEALSKLAAEAAAAGKSESKGLSDLVKSVGEAISGILDAFTGPLKYAAIACIICCIALVVLLVVMGLSPAGQSAAKNLGSAGTARLGRMKKF
jgi:hypothetical protein